MNKSPTGNSNNKKTRKRKPGTKRQRSSVLINYAESGESESCQNENYMKKKLRKQFRT